VNALSQSRVLAYERLIAAFNNNDLSVVAQVMAQDLVYTIPGSSPIAGRTEGILEHLAVLGKARALSGGTLKLTPAAVAVDGDYLLVWGRIQAHRSGYSLDAEHCVMYHFEGEKIVEGRTVPTDLYVFDDFWAKALSAEPLQQA
jgi:ketosteroid isomerase-like protein